MGEVQEGKGKKCEHSLLYSSGGQQWHYHPLGDIFATQGAMSAKGKGMAGGILREMKCIIYIGGLQDFKKRFPLVELSSKLT